MRRFLTLLALSFIPSMALLLAGKTPALAAFNPNSIMDDGVFNNSSTMNAAQIDSFLNGFPSSCISPNNGFSSPEPIGYSPSTSYQYGGNVSAGKVIYNISHVYGLNPQVLLATLQKEQSLVTGSAGCHPNTPDSNSTFQCNLWGTGNIPCTAACPDAYGGGCIPIAVGNNCPGNCQASTEGFSKQLTSAAWKLKFWQQRSEGNMGWNVQVRDFPYAGNVWDNSDDPQSCYSGSRMTQGYYQICPGGAYATYDGYTTINSGGLTVHLDNGATAALYNYTPFTSGNSSFYNIFTGWFGPVYSYTWQLVSESSSTGSFVLYTGQSATFTLIVKNTGPLTWSNSTNPVKLATWDPPYSRSPFDPGTWQSTYRPATLSEASVPPGGYGTFVFNVTAPSTPNFYVEHFNLVAEGAAWFVDAGVEFDVKVRPPNYTWQLVSQSSSTGSFVLAPGQSATFTMVAKNTGDLTWSNSTNPVNLATWSPSYRRSPFDPGSWPSTYRPASLSETSVPPGSNGTFVFSVKAPSAPNFYIERFNLVMEGVAWFTDPWAEFDVSVQRNLTWQMVSQSSSTGSFVLSKGQAATFTMVAKNTGNVAWDNSTNPIRLGTWNPSYRTSVFNDGTWPSAYRAATLQNSPVAPGQNGTFVFTVKAPPTAGSYYERFNLVAEGAAWFTDPWAEFDVIVR